jgi:glycosyltransferase involved in cell wall biosynthesis
VDDGSTDETASVLESFGRLGVRFVRQENRGVSAARNVGAAAGSGEYIAFLDSDDLWLPGKLRAQAAFFRQRPEALICQTEEIWIRNGVRVNPGRRHRKPSGMIFLPSLERCLVSPSAVMLRRDFFDATGGFDETLPACEDYDLWLRIACRHPIYRIDVPLVVKRGGHPDQLSRQAGLDRYRVRALNKLIESGRLDEAQRRAAADTLVTKCRIYAEGCRKRGRTAEAETFDRLAARHGAAAQRREQDGSGGRNRS